MSYLIDVSVLKTNHQYRLLYFGQFISFIGTMITSVCLPWQIYLLTHSSLQVGLLSLVQLLPLLLTALLGGVLADRYDRQKLILASEALLLCACIGLIINSQLSQPSLLVIYGIAGAMSAVTGLHRPSIESINQQLISAEHYKSIAALSSFKFGFCMIVGPAIGGFLIANYGLTFSYFFDFLTFLIAILCLIYMEKLPQSKHQNHPPVLIAIKEGLEFAKTNQELLGSYLVDFIAMVFAMSNALFPAIAESFGGAKTLGMLYAAPAVGALLISFISGWTADIKDDGKAIAIAATLWGISMIGFGMSTQLYLALFFLALSGMFDAISGIFRKALWNKVIPPSFRGRLAGIEMISYMGGPRLGDARAGALASIFGIQAAIVSGGILCVCAVITCCILMPRYWRYRAI